MLAPFGIVQADVFNASDHVFPVKNLSYIVRGWFLGFYTQ